MQRIWRIVFFLDFGFCNYSQIITVYDNIENNNFIHTIKIMSSLLECLLSK